MQWKLCGGGGGAGKRNPCISLQIQDQSKLPPPLPPCCHFIKLRQKSDELPANVLPVCVLLCVLLCVCVCCCVNRDRVRQADKQELSVSAQFCRVT